MRWRELTGQRDPDAGVDGLLRDFGREGNQQDGEGLRSEADLRRECRERFEDAQPGEFLTPVREATIFLHREVCYWGLLRYNMIFLVISSTR